MSNDMALFDRQYRLRARAVGRTGFEVGSCENECRQAIHCAFSIEKTDGAALNTTKISLWNLNDAHINTLMCTNCAIEICAGYKTRLPCIFRGTVSNVQTQLDGADRLTEISAIDGFAEIKDTFVTISYRGKVAVKKVVEDVAGKLGLPVVYSKQAKTAVAISSFSFGYCYVGAAKNALAEACKVAKTLWTIQNGILQIRCRGETVSNVAQLISKRTGLIGIPKKIYNSSVAAGENTESTIADSLFGYEVVYLMNGAIGINDLVKLESKMVTGFFRVYKLIIDGDNLEGDWQCTAQLVEVGNVT